MTTWSILSSGTCDNTITEPDYRWQADIISLWEQAGRRGIIEAAPASGKTRIAIEALARIRAQGATLKTLVVVPNKPLMDYWYDRLGLRFPGQRIARVGSQHSEGAGNPTLAHIMLIHSVRQCMPDALEYCWRTERDAGSNTFLVADEYSQYVRSPVWHQIVSSPYRWTYQMGLSDTVQPLKLAALGPKIANYDFRRAHDDGLVPHFHLVNVSIPLSAPERQRYFNLLDVVSKGFRNFFQNKPRYYYENDLWHVPDHWLLARLQQLLGEEGIRKERKIRQLFDLVCDRSKILYTAEGKLHFAEDATRQLIARDRKVAVFFDQIVAADLVNGNIPLQAAQSLGRRLLNGTGLWCKVYHPQMEPHRRRAVLAEFRQQKSGALLVCQSLDHSLDLPPVDDVILVASTRLANQCAQRLARVLRRENGSQPILVLLLAQDTGDAGVTERDCEELQGVARVRDVDAKHGQAFLLSLLN